MSIETGIVTALQEISGLKVYPNYTQEGTVTPNVQYEKTNVDYDRTLEGVTSVLNNDMFEFNLITDTKSDLVTDSDAIYSKLLSLWNTTTGGEYLQDIDVINRLSKYEADINKHGEVMEIVFSY